MSVTWSVIMSGGHDMSFPERLLWVLLDIGYDVLVTFTYPFVYLYLVFLILFFLAQATCLLPSRIWAKMVFSDRGLS